MTSAIISTVRSSECGDGLAGMSPRNCSRAITDYDEPTSGGANNYVARSVFGAITIKLP